MKEDIQNSAKSDNYMSPFPNPTPGQITIAALAPFSNSKLTGGQGLKDNVSKEDFAINI